MRAIFLFLLTITLFVSCSDDDKDNKPAVAWDGDWNDPDDPHYAIYFGKYNPIEGEWLVITQNGRVYEGFRLHKFTSGFVWQVANKKPEIGKQPNFNKGAKYAINGTAVQNKENGTIFSYRRTDLNTLTIEENGIVYNLQTYVPDDGAIELPPHK